MEGIGFKLKKLFILSSIALLPVTTSCLRSVTQELSSTDLPEFKIVIEKTDDRLTMQSIEGSAWTDLSFSLAYDEPQPVDEYGMTELNGSFSEQRLKPSGLPIYHNRN